MSVARLRPALVVVVAASTLVAAPPAQARGVHCGMRLRHSFTLRRNLRDCPGDGLVVAANNITLRLGGHTITGAERHGAAGIRVTGFHGITVTGGVIRRFGTGILLTGSHDDRLLDNTLTGDFDEGIFTTTSSPGTQIEGNHISGNGIRSGAPWADGIDARGDTTVVRGNTVVHNHDDGIDVGGRGDNIDGNRVDRSVHDGIDVDGSDVLVENNNSTRNGDDGIGVGREASNVTIRANVTNDNVDLGIQPLPGTAIDGGGNRAASNHDPRQCVQVICAP